MNFKPPKGTVKSTLRAAVFIKTETEKKFKKNEKKCLTGEKKYDIILNKMRNGKSLTTPERKKIMKKIININNREEIVEELAEMLVSFAKARNLYQTDVYLYYDEATCTASLDSYDNVGGNSWLDDDHYTIYIDRPHYDDEEYDDDCIDEAWQDFYQSAERILADWEQR